MRIVYPESRRFRISLSWSGCAALRILVVRSLRGDRIFCAVSARAAFRGCVRPLFPEPVRDGAGRGWFRAFVCSVVCRVLTICKHVPTCPDKGTRPAGRRAPEPLLFLRLTPPLFFSRHRRRKRGCGYPLLELPVRGRSFRPPSRRVFRRPLRRGGRVLPGQAPGIWSRMTGVLALRDRTLPGRPK